MAHSSLRNDAGAQQQVLRGQFTVNQGPGDKFSVVKTPRLSRKGKIDQYRPSSSALPSGVLQAGIISNKLDSTKRSWDVTLALLPRRRLSLLWERQRFARSAFGTSARMLALTPRLGSLEGQSHWLQWPLQGLGVSWGTLVTAPCTQLHPGSRHSELRKDGSCTNIGSVQVL